MKDKIETRIEPTQMGEIAHWMKANFKGNPKLFYFQAVQGGWYDISFRGTTYRSWNVRIGSEGMRKVFDELKNMVAEDNWEKVRELIELCGDVSVFKVFEFLVVGNKVLIARRYVKENPSKKFRIWLIDNASSDIDAVLNYTPREIPSTKEPFYIINPK